MFNKKGFTLIEVLLYIGIAAIIFAALAGFYFMVSQSRIKQQTINEVESQGVQAMQIITQAIRNARAVSLPSRGNSSAVLQLQMQESGKDPTIIDVSGGVLRISEGYGQPIQLTNLFVTVSGLHFVNASRVAPKGSVRIQFTLIRQNISGRNEYQYAKNFIGSASIR